MKEHIYDTQISPLMAQIIGICKQNNIAFVASFSVPDEGDSGLQCTSAILEPECDPPAHFVQALKLLTGSARVVATCAVDIGIAQRR